MPKVLVVDDEESATKLISAILDGRYDVVTETDATAAIARVERGERFQLAILDVVMPRVPGDELARAIRQHDRQTKILFVTGYSEALFQARPVLWEDEQFLDKPFTREGLLEAVEMALHGSTRPPAS